MRLTPGWDTDRAVRPRRRAGDAEAGSPGGPAVRYAARRAVWEFLQDQCIDSAGALTYFGVLSLFPALLALLSLLGVLGQGKQAADALLSIVAQVAPGSAATTIRAPIEAFVRSPGAGVTLVTGVVLGVWTASGYVSAFTRAMNRIYEVEEGRPYLLRKGVQLLITIALILLVALVAIVLVLSGPVADAVGGALGVGPTVEIVWTIAKWPVLLLVAVAIIAMLYWATPNVRQPGFRWLSVGGAVALAVLAVTSSAFLLYVTDFSHYGRSYGPLAGVIVFLIWLWIANLALLFGAEFDSELERGRELRAGLPAESVLQLPPRDAAGIAKKQEQADRLEQEARALHRRSRPPGTPDSEASRAEGT